MTTLVRAEYAEHKGASAQRLLVRPRPQPDEAATGYLIRLCSANGLTGLPDLRRMLLKLGGGDCRKGLQTAADLAAEAVGDLIGPYPSYWRLKGNLAGLARQDFNQLQLRWCPQCLAEVSYLRASWTLKWSCVCTKHRLWLQDRCPACGGHQVPTQADSWRCRCGNSLAEAPREPVSTPAWELESAFESAVFAGSNQQHWLHLSGPAWEKIIRYLGQFGEEVQPVHPGQLGNLHHLDVASPIFARIAALLDDWPRNFHHLLAAMLKGKPNSPSLRRTFGRLYHVIYEDLADETFQFVRTAFEGFLNDSWWGLVCRRHRSLGTVAVREHPRIPLAKAARTLGVGSRVVDHLVQASLIPADEATLPSGRVAKTVHRDSLPEVARLLASTLTLAESARLLAIPRHRVTELIEAQVLVPVMYKNQVHAGRWMLPTEQINQLNELDGADMQGVRTIQLSEILKYWRLRNGEFAALVRGIRSAKIKVVGTRSPTSFGYKQLIAEELRTWLVGWREATGEAISIDVASKYLGLKQQVAYELVARGILQAIRSASSVQQISMSDLRLFGEQYISLADIARHLNRAPRKVLGELSAVPVCGPSVDGCRQYFYRRADLRADELPQQLQL